MNFGTPQEMYDDDKEINPTTQEEDSFNFLFTVIYIVIISVIFYFL